MPTVAEAQLGMKVGIRFREGSLFGPSSLELRNVTEIHYSYPPEGTRIAFESDIHTTGFTCFVTDIAEFEATLETEKATAF